MKLIGRWLAVLGLIAGLTPLLPTNVAFADDTVVGNGSAVSCDEIAFDAALNVAHQNGGGEITFNCGGPATLNLTGLKTILTTNDVTINAESPTSRSLLQTILFSFGPTILLVGLFWWIGRRAAAGLGAGGGRHGSCRAIVDQTCHDLAGREPGRRCTSARFACRHAPTMRSAQGGRQGRTS